LGKTTAWIRAWKNVELEMKSMADSTNVAQLEKMAAELEMAVMMLKRSHSKRTLRNYRK
jgi:hypothetical protein